MKGTKKNPGKTIAASLKNMALQVKRKAAKHNQPIAVSEKGVLYFIDAKGEKTKSSS